MYPVTERDQADIEKRFTYHRPGGDQAERYVSLRAYARELATVLLRSVPDCRERDVALAKLEESIFWANAGIARNERWSEPAPAEPLPVGAHSLAAAVQANNPAPQTVKVEPPALPGPGASSPLSE